jgi:16S rRNA (guanine527-N7)-methyltransferase
MTVSRGTVEATVRRFDLADPAATATAIQALLEALVTEPDPPTTVRGPEEALDVHVADSLSGLEGPELRSARRIVDLGAGAGFPGLVLAAALPEARVDLVESTARKCDVIRRLAVAAGLEARAKPLPVRAEDHARGPGRSAYDVVTARALAPLAVICEYAAPLLRVDGVLVAWKGARSPDEEAAAARAASKVGLSAAQVIPVSPFPGTESKHLYVYSKISDTPSTFPRRAGLARKKPLG